MLTIHEKWRQTYLEAWPDEICALGLPFVEIPILEKDLLAIGSRCSEFRELFEIDELQCLSDDFLCTCESKISEFREGVHVRLGGCSFKIRGKAQSTPIWNKTHLEATILQSNPRVASLIADSINSNVGVSLFMRPWLNIPQWSEFRLFMRKRKILGSSQYFHTQFYPEIKENLNQIIQALVEFARTFRDLSHIEDAVVDVCLQSDGKGALKSILLDINPFILRTDSCLYNWHNDGDFDGGLRFRGENGQLLSLSPLPFNSAI